MPNAIQRYCRQLSPLKKKRKISNTLVAHNVPNFTNSLLISEDEDFSVLLNALQGRLIFVMISFYAFRP